MIDLMEDLYFFLQNKFRRIPEVEFRLIKKGSHEYVIERKRAEEEEWVKISAESYYRPAVEAFNSAIVYEKHDRLIRLQNKKIEESGPIIIRERSI